MGSFVIAKYFKRTKVVHGNYGNGPAAMALLEIE